MFDARSTLLLIDRLSHTCGVDDHPVGHRHQQTERHSK